MKIDVMFNCGNAPKMERVVDLTIAFAKKDADAVKSHVREDFVWKTVGKDEVISYDDLESVLPKRPDVKALHVENALSHGNGAMCEGKITFEDGDRLHFCTVVKFVNTAKNALIKEAHSYYVK